MEKKQKKNLTWSVERCSWTFEVRMRTIQNLWYWRFSAKDINKKIKTDNNSVANQHNEKICLNSSLASKHIISTSTLAQFSVHLFQGRRRWLCKCAFSLKLIKLEHRCAINQSQISHPSCFLSLERKMKFFWCSVHQLLENVSAKKSHWRFYKQLLVLRSTIECLMTR